MLNKPAEAPVPIFPVKAAVLSGFLTYGRNHFRTSSSTKAFTNIDTAVYQAQQATIEDDTTHNYGLFLPCVMISDYVGQKNM